MNKLNFNNDSGYVIEVNDRGDTIVLDYEDLEFVENVNKMYQEVHRATEVMEQSMKRVQKKSDDPVEGSLLSERELAMLDVMRAFYEKGRKAIDTAFGEGTSQAVFGPKNRLLMFNDFFEAVEPHLERAGIQLEDRMKDIRKKYEINEDKETVI